MVKNRMYGLLVLTIFLFVTSCDGFQTATPISSNIGYPPLSSEGLENGYPSQEMNPNLLFEPDSIPYIPDTAPEPLAENGSISGILYSFTTNLVLADTLFYLVPAIGQDKNQLPPMLFGPDSENIQIIGKTNDKGQFFMSNIPPGNYYLVVEAPMSWAVGLVEGRESSPRLLIIKSDEKNLLGIVYVSWP